MVCGGNDLEAYMRLIVSGVAPYKNTEKQEKSVIFQAAIVRSRKHCTDLYGQIGV